MALTGYDPTIVSASIGKVQAAYNSLIKVLGDDMQNQFVGGMATKWACPDAQNFFTQAFKPSVDGLITSSTNTFKSVVDAMNSAAKAWASQTSSVFTPVAFSNINKTMDVTVILENINGVRGIDLNEANTVAAKLSSIAAQAESALTQAQSAVRGCGFIGGSQEANLVGALGSIKTKIDEASKSLTSETKNAIAKTVENYSNTEGKVSEAFSLN